MEFEGGVAIFVHAAQAPKAVVRAARILNCIGIDGSTWGENRIQLKSAPPQIAPVVRAVAVSYTHLTLPTKRIV